MNIQAGIARLRYVGGRATVEQMAEWCDAPRDTTPDGERGYSKPGLVAMVGELAVAGVHQISSKGIDSMLAFVQPNPISVTDGTLAAAMLRAEMARAEEDAA